MKIRQLAALVGLALASTAANAVGISGTASLTGFFGSVSASPNAIVNNLNVIDVDPAALVGATTGMFAPNGVATATDFTIVPLAPGMIYMFNGLTFNIEGISMLARTALSCDGTGCTDDLSFNIAGTVTKAGFDPTLFTGTWTANGSCQQGAAALTCLTGTRSASWSVSLTAIAQTRVPEPGTLALLGLGLIGLGAARRRPA